MNNNTATITINGKLLAVYHSEGYSNVYTQPINPKTGQPWQARRAVATIRGEGHRVKAMALWLKTSRSMKKEVR